MCENRFLSLIKEESRLESTCQQQQMMAAQAAAAGGVVAAKTSQESGSGSSSASNSSGALTSNQNVMTQATLNNVAAMLPILTGVKFYAPPTSLIENETNIIRGDDEKRSLSSDFNDEVDDDTEEDEGENAAATRGFLKSLKLQTGGPGDDDVNERTAKIDPNLTCTSQI